MRLKLKDGTQRTLCSIRCSDIFTMPTWVTEATSLLGKLTKVFRVAMIMVKHAIECTIWFVAPVSMTQLVAWKTSLLTTLAEKIECFKEGVTKVEWALSEDVIDVEGTPVATGTLVAPKSMLETAALVLTLATWWLAPWSVP